MQTITPSDLRQHRMQMLHFPMAMAKALCSSSQMMPPTDLHSNGNGGVSIFLLRAQHLRYCATVATSDLQLATGNQQFSS